MRWKGGLGQRQDRDVGCGRCSPGGWDGTGWDDAVTPRRKYMSRWWKKQYGWGQNQQIDGPAAGVDWSLLFTPGIKI